MCQILYMPNLTAISPNHAIRTFHTRMCDKGKPKHVALVAAMRKLLTILNAVMRDKMPWLSEPVLTTIST